MSWSLGSIGFHFGTSVTLADTRSGSTNLKQHQR